MKKIIKIVLVASFFLINPMIQANNPSNSSLPQPKVLVWDLGLTLVKQAPVYRAFQVGLVPGLLLALQYGSRVGEVMRTSLYKVLDQYGDPEQSTDQCSQWTPLDSEGERPLPILMEQWFSGNKTSDQIRPLAAECVASYPHYEGYGHQWLMGNTADWMFTPERYAASWKPIDAAVALLEDCAVAKDMFGNPLSIQGIVSNWDKATYIHVRKDSRFDCIFSHFEPKNIFISAEWGRSKPYLYKFFLDQTGYKPSDCIVIDDQIDNCKFARSLGMIAIHVKNGDYEAVRQELIKYGVLINNTPN